MRMTIGMKGKGAVQADVEVYFSEKSENGQDSFAEKLPKAIQGRAKQLIARQKFVGKLGQLLLLPAEHDHGHIAVVGVGSGEGDVAKRYAEAFGVVLAAAKRLQVASVAVHAEELASDVITSLGMAASSAVYVFDTYKKLPKDAVVIDEVSFIVPEKTKATAQKALKDAEMVMDGVTVARDLVNMPAQDMTPTRLAEAAKKIAKNSQGTMKVQVLDAAACKKLGMGAYLAVAQGADEPPKFIHLTYTPPRGSKKTVAVVGKGVTFDSGGLSLKPADSMMTMKCDMAGAAAVLGLFTYLAKARPRVTVHGVIPATENMPSGKAIRPGDIVRSMSGKTIEILNTDAEGRLTLADAMTYILKKKPDVLIDLATLTGACMVALGEEIAGVMSNNKELAQSLLGAADRAGEKLWELPLEPRYRDLILSEIADLRNIPTSRYGGSLTAGLFLQEFVGETPWAHLDIAGPAFAEKPLASYIGRGGTGYGIKTLVEYVTTLA